MVTSPAQVARRSGHPSQGTRIYDWATLEELDEAHCFRHVSLRTGATKVAVCSCGWESERYHSGEDAVTAWFTHRDFAEITAGIDA